MVVGEEFPQGLKPWLIWAFSARPKEAAEKGLISSEIPEKHASGAEARVDFTCVIPGINPRPTARTIFSAACKVPIIFGVAARLQSCLDTSAAGFLRSLKASLWGEAFGISRIELGLMTGE